MNETGSIERPRCGETESGRSGHDDFQQRDDFGNFEANLRFLDATQALQPRPTLLEIGCGKGRLIKHLLDAGHDVRGCEVNLLMIDESRRLYGPLPIDPVDGTALPYPTATFDIVLSFDVFEHIPDSDAHLGGEAGASIRWALPAPDPQQVDQLRVRDDPVAKPDRVAAGSLLSPQRTRAQVTVVDTWVRHSVL